MVIVVETVEKREWLKSSVFYGINIAVLNHYAFVCSLEKGDPDTLDYPRIIIPLNLELVLWLFREDFR